MVDVRRPQQYRFGMVADGQDKIIEDYLERNRNKKLLHIGSSGERTLNQNISSLVKEVICGDSSLQAMKNLALHNLPNVTPLVMDAFEMPFPDDSIDTILAIGVQPLYTNDLSVVIRGLSEIHRVTAPSGEVLVCNKIGQNGFSQNCPKTTYERLATTTGYTIIGENTATDSAGETGGNPQRYVLVLKK